MSDQSLNDRSPLAARIVGNRAYDDMFRWVLLMALICLGAVILWDYGYLNYLIDNDTSGISTLIIAVFGVGSLYCLWFLFDLSGEMSALARVMRGLEDGGVPDMDSAIARLSQSRRVARVVGDLTTMQRTSAGSPETVLQAFASELRGPVRLGVFISDTLYKLGLLGTVIGFILMLVSMRDLGEFDVETMRAALQSMTGGMAVALLTTITGLSAGVLLRMQFNVLDSLALRITQTLVRFSEVVLPAVTKG
ncbi:MotA/TolQ/ExbB proton channel family protein [Maritimibacter sp. DP1N21-5]|uniref:MotA/TolQ/ExbB proton channel family protein n=1 Tax=Maritimibacter sp. DP1N21-5 TaxID=2836867 RepID=UPI001C45F7D6|nr:MotA/TolQ/ExbB proton channel family protein [Maritimibacter sp. DP1N21-5]MBV7407724.1 MotA/TolQ/ExbB proton channel family protein [Maritimibacter sp. DP1N21-5]